MAEQGMGIAYLPDFAIGRQLREGILVTVLDDYTDRSGPLRVLWPSSRHLAPKLRVFVDFLAANLVPAVEGEADRALHPPTASGPSVRHASPSSTPRRKAL
jgi:DNA-binding transcriptional LysR family regulator